MTWRCRKRTPASGATNSLCCVGRNASGSSRSRWPRRPPTALVFATSSGGPHNPSNVRNRVLTKAVDKSNEQREKDGQVPLPRLTPHSPRRTFASLLYGLGRTPVEVMDQLGHTDPKLALRLYARAMRRDEGETERLKALAGVADWAPMGTGAKIEAAEASKGEPRIRSRMPAEGA